MPTPLGYRGARDRAVPARGLSQVAHRLRKEPRFNHARAQAATGTRRNTTAFPVTNSLRPGMTGLCPTRKARSVPAHRAQGGVVRVPSGKGIFARGLPAASGRVGMVTPRGGGTQSRAWIRGFSRERSLVDPGALRYLRLGQLLLEPCFRTSRFPPASLQTGRRASRVYRRAASPPRRARCARSPSR